MNILNCHKRPWWHHATIIICVKLGYQPICINKNKIPQQTLIRSRITAFLTNVYHLLLSIFLYNHQSRQPILLTPTVNVKRSWRSCKDTSPDARRDNQQVVGLSLDYPVLRYLVTVDVINTLILCKYNWFPLYCVCSTMFDMQNLVNLLYYNLIYYSLTLCHLRPPIILRTPV